GFSEVTFFFFFGDFTCVGHILPAFLFSLQNEMCLATQQLSKQLLAYEKQNFALGKGDEEVISTLHYFSKVVDELNVLHTELAKQLADTMVLPIIQFREKDLTGKVTEFSANYLQNINSFHNRSDCTNFFKYVHQGFDFPLPLLYSSQNLRNLELENDKIVPKAAARVPDADELIAPGTPIQFDIVLPATEFLDQNRGSRRINPFGETEDETFPEAEDSLLQQMFIVRFLGSMAVKTDSTTEVIYEAMRQVLAARAIHNIFRTTESHLLVTSQTLRLIDPQTQVTRANFELTSITQFAAHQENKRLVGFVVRTPESTGGEALSTYVFESNSEGEKICYAINLGKEIIEVQKDPEALAQLMLSIPLTNDGKYVLLNDQPDDNDGSPSENRGAESEA
ncbi:DCC-interacting protein 13-beta-like, partial [Leptonychotes weddellii]|uniref:DCC-interacting protein 13-beta-like n=1 Tax=Leptonychotes weddellii TaxID=9713 RepID=A0A7F8QF16_LEPWE